MRKALAIAAVGIVFALVAAVSAKATRPEIVPVGNTDIVFAGVCQFDVGVHIVADNEFAKIFSNGDVIVTGTLKVVVTNLSNGKSEALNVSGPGFFITSPAGALVFKGAGRGFGPVNGTLLLGSGLVVVPIDPPGETTTRGHFTDLCVALA